MRLIDADKLYPDCLDKTGRLAISQSQIANAPTVPLPDFKEGYKQAIIDGKTNFSRPQGQWIKNTGRDLRDNFYTCSVCGRSIDVICGENLVDYPFCHCGAAMGGGVENEIR